MKQTLNGYECEVPDHVAAKLKGYTDRGFAVELSYEWRRTGEGGKEELWLRDVFGIDPEKVSYRWDGTPGIRVTDQYPGTKEMTDRGWVHFLATEELALYVLPVDPV